MATPHVSAAVVQLRQWVLLAAAVLVLSTAAQLLIFGFVHYTDVRWTSVEAKAPDRVSAEVVRAQPKSGEKVLLTMDERAPKPVDVNRVLSPTDGFMREASKFATLAGSIAAVVLCLLTMLGVSVAGGAAIPGVEKAVTACVWSMVLAMLVLPLRDAVPSLLWPGVFSSYESMVAASEAQRADGETALTLLGVYALMPLAVLVAAVMIGVWFRSGVEAGVIMTTVQQIDHALERELAAVRSRGVAAAPSGSGSRAMGALSRTIGDVASSPATELRMAAGAESMAMDASGMSPALLRGIPPAEGRRIGQVSPGSPEARPI
ncbi:MAG: hypothetical protein KF745_06710 [Phycisphaeraceae bacterium]|nr:hypothetical protein [Phycisphaeraceae bacterium]